MYVRTVAPHPKNVVIVIDRSTALSLHQLNVAKELARQTLLSLSPDDKVSCCVIPKVSRYYTSKVSQYGDN